MEAGTTHIDIAERDTSRPAADPAPQHMSIRGAFTGLHTLLHRPSWGQTQDLRWCRPTYVPASKLDGESSGSMSTRRRAHKRNQPGIVELTVGSGLTEMSVSVRQSEPPRTASSALRDPTSWAGPGNATGRTAHPFRDLETSWLERSRPHRCQAVPTEAIGRCRAPRPAC